MLRYDVLRQKGSQALHILFLRTGYKKKDKEKRLVRLVASSMEDVLARWEDDLATCFRESNSSKTQPISDFYIADLPRHETSSRTL